MSSATPLPLLRLHYHEAAQAYLKSLPLEHFMEATPQATQRKITLESLDLVHVRRPEVQVFNELLVQYPLERHKKLGQVVPDNMVVVHPEPLDVEGSFDIPLQPVRPLWVLEYVSKSSKRKDYDESRRKYEKELKVPYYLLFVPESEEMVLFHHNRRRYVTVVPDRQGRAALEELELELGLLGGWVRFWFRGALLPLPGELVAEMDQLKQERDQLKQDRDQLKQDRDQLKQDRDQLKQDRDRLQQQLAQAEQHAGALEAEVARLKAELSLPKSGD